eukprot:scaffold12744_cov42-Cyclotella_meneghiniana.AAC.2
MQTGLTRGSHNAGDESKRIDEYLRKSTAVPSATSSSSDPLGWQRKHLEVNPRIRFNHRGQVAAAFPLKDTPNNNNNNAVTTNNNNDDDDSLRYQFFITLDESPFLDSQHVIFGTIAGPTVFNALRISKTDVDETSGTPLDMTDCPPRITSVKIDYHPFHDLVISSDDIVPWRIVGNNKDGGKRQSEMEKRRKKRKGKRDLNVLSFGDEERLFEESLAVDNTNNNGSGAKKKIQSSHDVLHGESELLSSSVDADLKKRVEESNVDDEVVGNKAKRTNDEDATRETKRKKKTVPTETPLLSQENTNVVSTNDTLTATKQQQQSESIVNNNTTSQTKSLESKEKTQKTKSSIGAVQARRAKYLKGGTASLASKKERLKREDDTMAKLMAFRSKILDNTNKRISSSSSSSSKHATHKDGDASENEVDDSLASRMAKRVQEAQEDKAKAIKQKEDFIAAPGYHGQVLDDDDDNNDDNDSTENDTTNWLRTKFKCKRHIDHDSRVSALERGDNHDNVDDEEGGGGDGRHMDDYLVVDEKRKRSHNGDFHSKQHRHHSNHSSHKSDHRKHRDHHRR